ncbi:RIP metalloprotease RseP [Thermovenabulum sp.]|uniref:RIP metalloprotease RseP n=1 Tax=Thermovenabulum sp. TaxID=3100335 RepID=UPI003C79F97B
MGNTIIISIIILGALVIAHEFGHFIMAKKSDMKVNEFAIGFGLSIFSKRIGETVYSLKIFPLGGYVKIEGEDEKTNDPRSFANKPLISRMAVVLAGPLMNLLLGALLFSVVAFFTGITTTSVEVIPDSPAFKAGIRDGDVIYKIDGEKISSWENIVDIISNRPDKEINIEIKRGESIIPLRVRTQIDPQTKRGIIGIKSKMIKYSFFPSLIFGFNRMFYVVKMIVISLVTTGIRTQDLVGPVGMVHIVGEAAKFGIFNVIFLAAIISINLGLFNLFPIPALDGSRIIFLLIELVRKKPVDPEKEGMIHFIGFAILIILAIFIAYKDFIKFY